MTLPSSKRSVALLVAVPALVLLLATTRTWVTGRTSDPLLGGAVAATGGQVAPAATACGAVALAATVAMLTAGRRGRLAAAALLVLAAAGAVLSVVTVLRDPGAALGRVAASGLGRSTPVETTAAVTGWVWVAVGAGAVLLVGSLLAVRAVGRWQGLSGRYDAPAAGGPDAAGEVSAGRRGERLTTWDDLSRGVDPTDGSDLPQ